jgi:hypothetical protein
MGVHISVREEEKKRIERVIEEYFKRKRLIAMETHDSLNPIFFEYENGKYWKTGDEIMKAGIIVYYEELHTLKPFRYYKWAVDEIKRRAPRVKPDDFFKIENGTYRIFGVKNDLMVNINTGEIKVVDKDPINYPSVYALPYDLSKKPPTEMPNELKQILTITPPQFQDALLFELTAPLAYQKQVFVDYIVDYWAEALDTINNVLHQLYWDEEKLMAVGEYWTEFDKAYFFDKLFIYSYCPGKSKGLKEFIDTSIITGKFKYHAPFSFRNRFPITIVADYYKDMPDHTVLKDAIIIPITYTVIGTPDPTDISGKVRFIHWSHETRENIILWLIYNVLPRYLRGEHKKYMNLFSLETLKEWEKYGSPDDGVYRFTKEFIYEECTVEYKAHSIIMTTENAYQIYLKWGYGKYMPASQRQFLEKLGSSVKDGKVCVKKNAIASIFTGQ